MANNTLAYGFVGKEALLSKRLTEVNTRVVWEAIRESVNEHNRQIEQLISAFVFQTELHKERFRLPVSGTLQPLDEYGNPRPVRPGASYDVAYPIFHAGTAFGLNRITAALATVEETNELTIERLKEDADWMKRHILASVFDNTSWNFEDEEFGTLAIQPLANGDTVTYNFTGGTTTTDDHYLAQAAAIADNADPYDDIYTELMEHPSNSGPVVAYIPTASVATTKALTAFVEVGDPDLNYGSGTTTLRSSFNKGFGDTVLGKVDNVWVVEWRALPTGYILAHAQGAGAFVGQRQYPSAALRGLFQENFSPDGNLQETRFLRMAGFGVRNRLAACVYQIGNATYQIPSGYETPLAV